MYIDTGLRGCTFITCKPQPLPKKFRGKNHLNYSRTVALDDIYTACNVFIRTNSQAQMSRVQARIKATQNNLLGSGTQSIQYCKLVLCFIYYNEKNPVVLHFGW